MRLYPFFTIVLALAPAVVMGQAPPQPVAQSWIAAARDHQPGTIDAPLREISGWTVDQFEAVRRHLRYALEKLVERPEQRNDVLRRGVLLHTDVAILMPDRAATFTRLPEQESAGPLFRRPDKRAPAPPSIVIGRDGEFLGSEAITAHWMFARVLVEMLEPDPSGDPFAARWYRATTARFEEAYFLGHAMPHLARARKVLPRDPWILFYSGAMHEAFASSRFQNIARTQPRVQGERRSVRPPDAELREAAQYYRDALDVDPTLAEARLRLGRVLGLLGRGAESLEELRRAQTTSAGPAFQYFFEMFLGAALDARGRPDEARHAFDRAASLFPAAQAPSIARSELARRSGDRAGALAALQQLTGVSDPDDTIDPWWIYLRSHALHAKALLDDVRKPFLRGPR